jgi:hypothetical protein
MALITENLIHLQYFRYLIVIQLLNKEYCFVCLTAGKVNDLHSVIVSNQITGRAISTTCGRIQAEWLKPLLTKVPYNCVRAPRIFTLWECRHFQNPADVFPWHSYPIKRQGPLLFCFSSLREHLIAWWLPVSHARRHLVHADGISCCAKGVLKQLKLGTWYVVLCFKKATANDTELYRNLTCFIPDVNGGEASVWLRTDFYVSTKRYSLSE